MNTDLTLNFPKADGSCMYSADARKKLIQGFESGTYNKCAEKELVDGYYGLANTKGYWTYVGLDRAGENKWRLWSYCDNVVQPNVEQELTKLDEVTHKNTTVYNHGPSNRTPLGKTAVRKETLFANGDYIVERTMNGKPMGGYECNINEIGQSARSAERKLLTGFKGKIEKLAMNIAQDANGCERLVLSKVSGKVINMLRHIK